MINTGKSTNKINYLYDAAGTKLREQTKINEYIDKTTDYIGNFVYLQNNLKYVLTEEGRVVKDGSNYNFEYFLKDHLGNTRVTLDANGQVIQEDAYYPFGMQMDALCNQDGVNDENKYLYNGKEMQDEFGLDWYDYGARFYDGALGRWFVVDPMFDRHYSLSPYLYGLNNPIRKIDFSGLTDWDAVISGSVALAGGTFSVVLGVFAFSTPTGVSQVAGAYCISTGIPAMGLGIGKIAAGFADNGTADQIPTGMGEATGMLVDGFNGVDKGDGVARQSGAVVDVVAGLLVGGPPKTDLGKGILIYNAISTTTDIINSEIDNSETTTTNESKESKSVTAVSDNTNFVIERIDDKTLDEKKPDNPLYQPSQQPIYTPSPDGL